LPNLSCSSGRSGRLVKAWLAPEDVGAAAGLVGAGDSFDKLALRAALEAVTAVVGTLEVARAEVDLAEAGLLLLLLAAVDGTDDWSVVFGFGGGAATSGLGVFRFGGGAASGFGEPASGAGVVAEDVFFLNVGVEAGLSLGVDDIIGRGGSRAAGGDDGLSFFGGSCAVGSEFLRFLSLALPSKASRRQSIAPRSSAAWRTVAETKKDVLLSAVTLQSRESASRTDRCCSDPCCSP
jgi:hypothetical protein